MRYIIAILLPWVSFFLLDRPIYALICLGLQVSIIGWIPAAIWAVYAQVQASRLEKMQTQKLADLQARQSPRPSNEPSTKE